MASNDLGLLASVSLGSSLLALGGADLVTNRRDARVWLLRQEPENLLSFCLTLSWYPMTRHHDTSAAL